MNTIMTGEYTRNTTQPISWSYEQLSEQALKEDENHKAGSQERKPNKLVELVWEDFK